MPSFYIFHGIRWIGLHIEVSFDRIGRLIAKSNDRGLLLNNISATYVNHGNRSIVMLNNRTITFINVLKMDFSHRR